jgi:hypothetical protein
MAKRKRKEPAEAVNGELKQSKYTSRLFNDGRKLREIAVACGHLKRVGAPGPVHLQKFIDRVFSIAGVEQESDNAAQGEAQS